MRRIAMARVSKRTAASKSGRKSKKGISKRPTRKASRVTTQVKHSAMKVLAGAASGAVQALIPQLEDAAGRSAKSAATSKASARQQRSRE
jgi:hypothetical protein